MRKAPIEKRKVLRERAETEMPPNNISARVIVGISFHNKGQQRHRQEAVLWQSETEELEGHNGLKSGEDVQR